MTAPRPDLAVVEAIRDGLRHELASRESMLLVKGMDIDDPEVGFKCDPNFYRTQAAIIEMVRSRLNALDALLAERAASAIPDGWKLVPVEPTNAMLKAGGAYIADMVGDPYNSWNHFTGEAASCWKLMFAAAPQPKGPDE